MLGFLDPLEALQSRLLDAIGDAVIVTVWHYDRPVDHARLREFHVALQRGPLGRSIEASPIRGASGRWVMADTFAELFVEPHPIAREQFEGWLDSRIAEPLSTAGGPGWRLSTTAFADGGSAVCLVATHKIADVKAISQAVAQAVRTDESGADQVSSNGTGRRSSLAEYLAAITMRSAVGCTLAIRRVASIVARQSNTQQIASAETGGNTSSEPSGPPPRPARVAVAIPAEQWQQSAEKLNGSTTSLCAAVTASIASALGRVNGDGVATLLMPVSTRTGPDDIRGNAIASTPLNVPVSFDGSKAPDLAQIRQLIKQSLAAQPSRKRDRRDARALISLPQAQFSEVVEMAGEHLATDQSVCSVVGKLDHKLPFIDGGEASSVWAGLVNPQLEDGRALQSQSSMLSVLIVEACGQIALRFVGFHDDRVADTAQLRSLVLDVFESYGMSAVSLT
ncbi:hypothetical protein [Antrihabitans stalactiti]|uniref:Uncharacterized protein n=1 Tax=Antrihabitans stalactiti TaxID=2584121 RepID=A0A848KLY3_9NOCA|nr:hypothetical protein [Antrihabitans stalactiti]NMN97270.1 hypothetical protein [Antrihabitans stalactiti]